MEQHPIPQQISSYQFKLVGDMTLKQFFQVAGGVIVSLIFYSTPLHPIIKWPLILISAGLGAAMAFLPFQERPLERWIFAFFRSIYSPTLYSWKKAEKPPVYFTETAVVPAVNNVPTGITTEINSKKLEDAEKSFLSKIGGLFTINNQTPVSNNQTQPVAPMQSPAVAPVSFTPPVVKVDNTTTEPVTRNPTPVLTTPQQVPTVITKSAPKLVVEESSPVSTRNPTPVTEITGEAIKEKEITSNTVEFSIDAAPPSPPIVINTVVGQVMDQDRKIIEGAIMEIKDSAGRPVRALRSNKAGHFIIVTPLANGKYEITTEKDGFKFEPVSFETKGEMIPAIAIRGNRV